jgi:hypothetical protein
MVVVHCQQIDMRFMMKKKLWFLSVVVLVPISILALRAKPQPKPLSELPPVIVWAWERPEKLGFIDTDRIGVAFLAKTLRLQGDRVVSKPRLQPLELAAGTKLIAVVRIETNRPTLSQAQLSRTTSEITELAKLSGIAVVQIDFDAAVSERDFYRALLNEVKPRVPSLSITALASWCSGDNWLTGLPIDEAVPMLFRMGLDQKHFQSTQRFEPAICANSAGVSTDEPITPPAVDRLYIFNPNPWSRDSLKSALETYKK